MKIKRIILICIVSVFVCSCSQSPEPTAEPTPVIIRTPEPVVVIQGGNTQPQQQLSLRPSRELEDNRIGVHFEHYDRYSDTDHVYRNGFKWIRIQSLTEFWGDGNDLKIFTLESIPSYVDDTISDYVDNGVNIVLDLWMGAGLVPYGTTFQTTEEIDQYLDYVRFVVSHFKGRIGYYQIWNEPGHIAVSDYANLVKQVVPVIREADPGAKIIIGGTQGDWVNDYPGYGEFQRFSVDMNYLNELLRSDVAHMVDGISWHPFYGNMPGDPYYQDYPQLLQGIKELAESQGFTGEYFADELLWATVTEEGWDGGPPLSRPIAARYYTRAIAMHRGLGVNVTINTFFQEPLLSPIHNLCVALAGAEPIDLLLSVESEASNIVHYAFALPNGDKLVALWTNGEVVEDYPGASAAITIDNVSAQRVIGVDVYNGFEQELNAEAEDGNLVIRDLLIKDYPLLINISENASP
jgi:hypothetical protein